MVFSAYYFRTEAPEAFSKWPDERATSLSKNSYVSDSRKDSGPIK